MNPLHLLEQAEQLASSGAGLPRQTDLRRAVSAAYYALFHLLTQDGAQRLARRELRSLIARKYEHGLMREVSDRVARDVPPEKALGSLVSAWPTELREVAEAFRDLQAVRHRADYDGQPASDFDRSEVAGLIRRVQSAFDAWQRVRSDVAAEVYLLAMMFKQFGR